MGVLVPQALAYASLAGVPAVVGLYTALGVMALCAVFGTSRELNVGPEGTVAILVAPLAGGDVARYLTFTAALAILVGIVSVLGGFLKLGWITRFLSRPVLLGYILGSTIIIAVSQVGSLFGINTPTLVATLQNLSDINWSTLAVGALTVIVVLAARRLGSHMPAYLIGMGVATLVVAIGDLTEQRVAVIGNIPPGLPTFGLSNLAAGELLSLLLPALVVALLMYADSLLTE